VSILTFTASGSDKALTLTYDNTSFDNGLLKFV
jgi:hypothetical protein